MPAGDRWSSASAIPTGATTRSAARWSAACAGRRPKASRCCTESGEATSLLELAAGSRCRDSRRCRRLGRRAGHGPPVSTPARGPLPSRVRAAVVARVRPGARRSSSRARSARCRAAASSTRSRGAASSRVRRCRRRSPRAGAAVVERILDELRSPAGRQASEPMHEACLDDQPDAPDPRRRRGRGGSAGGRRSRSGCGALSHMSRGHFAEHFEQAAAGTIAEGAELDVTVSDDLADPRAQDIVLESVEVET